MPRAPEKAPKPYIAIAVAKIQAATSIRTVRVTFIGRSGLKGSTVDLDEKKRLAKNWRGRRLMACRAIDDLERIISELGSEDRETPHPDGAVPAVTETPRHGISHLKGNSGERDPLKSG